MSGVHGLNDPVRGFIGDHCLVWFSNTGYLDTTKTHRKCAGSLDIFRELPNGQFIGSLGNPPNTASWEAQPTGSNVIRFDADGEWDPSFQANVWWGSVWAFLPLEDGRVYAGGRFRITGLPDTLHLVRFMPDGSLDPTFNNFLDFRITEITNLPNGALIRGLHQLNESRLVVMGQFELIEGEARRNICSIDTSGNLMNDYFSGPGCGNFVYQGQTSSSIGGLVPALDGSYYICGAYHGYDDGTTNDTLQRMVSRLHGLNVGIQGDVGEPILVRPYPNPGSDHVRLSGLRPEEQVEVRFLDASGRAVSEHRAVTSSTTIFVGDLSAGMYVVLVTSTHHTNVRSLWLKQ
jgi:hypothetical protein